MKKALILAITFVAAAISSFAQDQGLTWGMVTTSVEKSDKTIQDAEKAKDPKNWIERCRVYVNLYTFDIQGLYVGMTALELQGVKQGQDPKKRTDGATEIWSYERIEVYLKDSKVEKWVITAPFRVEPLYTAFEAVEKASSLDSLKKQSKKIKEKAELLKQPAFLKGLGYEKYKIADASKSEADFKAALPYFEAVVKVNALPAVNTIDTMAINNAGVIANLAKEYEKAIMYFDKAAALNYGGPGLYLEMYKVYKASNNEAKAIAKLEEGIAKFGDKAGDIIIELINFYLTAGKDKEAMDYLQKAIAASPNNPTYYFALGTLYDKTKQNDKAIETYQKAISMDANYVDAYFNLGASYYNAGVEHFKLADETKDNTVFEKEKKIALEQYQKAMPFLEKVLELTKEKDVKLSALASLKTISFKLNDMVKYGQYKKQLESLK